MNRKNAFTLAELLVVIGIIVLLVSMLLPTVSRSMRSASRIRTQADFQTIATALEAYRQDFGDIPRIPVTTGPMWSLPTAAPYRNVGAAVLGKALMGPYGDGVLPTSASNADPADPPAYQATVPYKAGDVVRATNSLTAPQYVTLRDIPLGIPLADESAWAHFDGNDGKDGPGFIIRRGGSKVWGLYLQAGKVKSNGVYLFDHTGSPILYFPARPGRSSVTRDPSSTPGPPAPMPYVDVPLNTGVTSIATSLYNAGDNIEAFRHPPEAPGAPDEIKAMNRIRIMLNDFSTNGIVNTDKGETAITQPYLLWASGQDGVFGPASFTPADGGTGDDANKNRTAVEKCDDVTNFR